MIGTNNSCATHINSCCNVQIRLHMLCVVSVQLLRAMMVLLQERVATSPVSMAIQTVTLRDCSVFANDCSTKTTTIHVSMRSLLRGQTICDTCRDSTVLLILDCLSEPSVVKVRPKDAEHYVPTQFKSCFSSVADVTLGQTSYSLDEVIIFPTSNLSTTGNTKSLKARRVATFTHSLTTKFLATSSSKMKSRTLDQMIYVLFCLRLVASRLYSC